MAEQLRCIIHSPSVSKGERLCTSRNFQSWQNLLEAAKVRHHMPLLSVAETLEGEQIPNIAYHRTCRVQFTMKRELEMLKRKGHSSDEDLGEKTSVKRLQRELPSRETRVYEAVCIFCRRNKYIKKENSREKLIQARQLRVDETLRQCATAKEMIGFSASQLEM